MAITITTDLVDVDLAEATTNWATIGTWATAITISPDTFVQGANDIGGRCSASTAWAHVTAGAVNLTTGGVHVYAWLKCISIPQLDTTANGGLGITISSDATPTLTGTTPSNGPTNSKTWYVGGNEQALNGWNCYVVDPNSTPTLTIGTPNIAAVNRIGIRAKVVAAVGGGSVKPVNIVFDAVRRGTGLTYTGDNAGTPGAFSDILTTAMSVTNAWGILTSQSSIYFGAGKFNFGTAAQTATSSFKSVGQTFAWLNYPVASTFYAWVITGATGFATTFQLGNLTSGIASSGLTIKGAGDTTTASFAVWTLTVGTNATVYLYGTTFTEMLAATLSSTTTVNGCTFSNCGTITSNQAVITGTTFQSVRTTAPISATWGLIINSVAQLSNVTQCNFISCGRAIKITAIGTYTLDGSLFSGNSYDIENSSSGLVTINCINGSNPTTYINTGGGTTTINNARSLTITGLNAGSTIAVFDTNGTPTNYADDVQIAGTTNSSASFTYNYNWTGTAMMVNIVVIDLNSNMVRYSDQSLGANGVSLIVQPQTDRQYFNPI